MTNDQANLEIQMKEAKEAISKSEALAKLSKNSDFKKVILKGYFEEEASQLVLTKAQPGLQSSEHQEAIGKAIDSIGALRQYFLMTQEFGRQAVAALNEQEEAMEEILEEAGE